MLKCKRITACGLLFCYNEEDVIGETIKYYLSQNIDLVIFDNLSTDSSMAIVDRFIREGCLYAGKIYDVVHVATEGYDWKNILYKANEYMHKNLGHYEWILVIDADTHYASPIKGLTLLEYMDGIGRFGYNIIQGRAFTFFPTEKDEHSIADYSKRIKYCSQSYIYPQEKIFRYHHTVDFYSRYAHMCLRDNRRVNINPGFILKHYIWVSYEQGVKKVFESRKPRYRKDLTIKIQYANMLPFKKDFIRDSQTLMFYNEKRHLITRWQFSFLIRCILIHGILLKRQINRNTLFSDKNPEHSDIIAKNFFFDRGLSFSPTKTNVGSIQIIARQFKKAAVVLLPISSKRYAEYFIKLLFPYPINPSQGYYYSNPDFYNLIDKWITPALGNPAAILNLPLISYPSVYHFLMTSFCNAKCIFCNQLDNKPVKEIRLEEFKIMFSHIDTKPVRVFYFSGGGEPLLCKDLFDIIRFVKSSAPMIKIKVITNGLLIGKYAQEIAESGIDELIISVHGAEDVNNDILQIKDSKSIFSGISILNKYQQKFNKEIKKYFSVVVSSLNINEVPELIKMASDLDVNGVSVAFCRYYPHRIGGRLKMEDSLFFNKKLYNVVTQKAAKLAWRLGVSFSCAPSFLNEFKRKRCCAPWYMVIVDWEGDIYPCSGGEEIFYEKVKSRRYYFGNLLKEDIMSAVLNESYIKLRRHLLTYFKEKNIPECDTCHNMIYFEGPDSRDSHILN